MSARFKCSNGEGVEERERKIIKRKRSRNGGTSL
jgi:hypothetical protein